MSFNLRNLSPLWYGAAHLVITGLIFGLPLILTAYPKIGDLTVSAIVVGIVNWLEQNLANKPTQIPVSTPPANPQ